MSAISRAKYTGSALPGNAEVVVLYATAPTYTAGVSDNLGYNLANFHQCSGVKRVVVALRNDQTGTLKAYESNNRGVTWTQITADTAVAAAAANSQNIYDFLVEPYQDWKVTWTNGATPQTAFSPDITLTDERVIAN
jgi:hypothetical protein